MFSEESQLRSCPTTDLLSNGDDVVIPGDVAANLQILTVAIERYGRVHLIRVYGYIIRVLLRHLDLRTPDAPEWNGEPVFQDQCPPDSFAYLDVDHLDHFGMTRQVRSATLFGFNCSRPPT